jgi:hypothetical protein
VYLLLFELRCRLRKIQINLIFMSRVLFFLVLVNFGQIRAQNKQIDSVCRICDTMAVRYCGQNRVTYRTPEAQKLTSDLLLLRKLQYFLKNNDTTFFENLVNDGELVKRIQNSDTVYRREVLNILITRGSIIKGFKITESATIMCDNVQGSIDVLIDTRFFKKYIRPVLKFPYRFECIRISILYSDDFFFDDKIKQPTPVKKTHAKAM